VSSAGRRRCPRRRPHTSGTADDRPPLPRLRHGQHRRTRFCQGCGTPLGDQAAGANGCRPPERLLWRGRPSPLLARLLGHGDVRLLATGRAAPEKRLYHVPNPDRLKDLVRDAARADRERRRVLLRNEV